MTWHHPDGTVRRQPVFNAPRAVVWLTGALVLVHLLKEFVFSARLQASLAFIPARFSAAEGAQDQFVGGALSKWTSLVTHIFLHGNWLHLLFNSAWLLIFGTPVAARLGTARFLVLFFLAGIAGAATHGLVGWIGDLVTGAPRYPPEVLVGASGAISGLMGAAARFIVLGPAMATAGYDRPLLPLNDNQVVTFTVLWVAINLLFAVTGGMGLGMGHGISWQAHLGGYFAGLLLIPVIDGRRRA